jgi:hypothetical protein
MAGAGYILGGGETWGKAACMIGSIGGCQLVIPWGDCIIF